MRKLKNKVKKEKREYPYIANGTLFHPYIDGVPVEWGDAVPDVSKTVSDTSKTVWLPVMTSDYFGTDYQQGDTINIEIPSSYADFVLSCYDYDPLYTIFYNGSELHLNLECDDSTIHNNIRNIEDMLRTGIVTRDVCKLVTDMRNRLDLKRNKMLDHTYELNVNGGFVLNYSYIVFDDIDEGFIGIYGLTLKVNDELRDEIKKQLELYNKPHYVTLLGKDYRLSREAITDILSTVTDRSHGLDSIIKKQLEYVLNHTIQVKSSMRSQT